MKKILIIEDDQGIAELQRDYLEVAGFSVKICSDGISGMQSIQDEEHDLIILDIMLPGMDGLKILQNVRDEKDVPILLVSAKKDEIDKIKGFGLGADDYITKPFLPGELVARATAHIEKYERLKNKYGSSSKGLTLNIRGLEIQRDSRRVFVNGKEVNLAQKEFELLCFMAQNPNRVFDREFLFEKIWGLDSLGDTSTVTVHVARIREKIEANPSNPQYIETVWGAGYRFRA
ncbi:winged helix family two component transcriptional regulator [Anaerobacterium chartisolvens]|uniref:Stage 0 sporulation protein A homolog n=1 Tax=Anaerobacterium chartisolvens TaxID=1297424 RepID=A0A369AMW4_9FIRM|nr:response regulator transcription factor [Anaerobacterium chartisolvens]RCX09616.1 winged helix family two component transcriptional regulator [Anaerobacterium chartisolvens]